MPNVYLTQLLGMLGAKDQARDAPSPAQQLLSLYKDPGLTPLDLLANEALAVLQAHRGAIPANIPAGLRRRIEDVCARVPGPAVTREHLPDVAQLLVDFCAFASHQPSAEGTAHPIDFLFTGLNDRNLPVEPDCERLCAALILPFCEEWVARTGLYLSGSVAAAEDGLTPAEQHRLPLDIAVALVRGTAHGGGISVWAEDAWRQGLREFVRNQVRGQYWLAEAIGGGLVGRAVKHRIAVGWVAVFPPCGQCEGTSKSPSVPVSICRECLEKLLASGRAWQPCPECSDRHACSAGHPLDAHSLDGIRRARLIHLVDGWEQGDSELHVAAPTGLFFRCNGPLKNHFRTGDATGDCVCGNLNLSKRSTTLNVVVHDIARDGSRLPYFDPARLNVVKLYRRKFQAQAKSSFEAAAAYAAWSRPQAESLSAKYCDLFAAVCASLLSLSGFEASGGAAMEDADFAAILDVLETAWAPRRTETRARVRTRRQQWLLKALIPLVDARLADTSRTQFLDDFYSWFGQHFDPMFEADDQGEAPADDAVADDVEAHDDPLLEGEATHDDAAQGEEDA